MFKIQHVKEEDYWVYPIVIVNVLCIVVALYASVLKFRVPAIVLGYLGIWFTSSKIRRSYSVKRARLHIALTVIAGLALTWLVYVLTN